MDRVLPTPLLGGLSPRVFMRRHWQKKPLLIRQAVAGDMALPNRTQLFALAANDAVESRLIVRTGSGWSLRHGPIKRRAMPALKTPGWTLLVQGVDLHLQAAHELLGRFRFVPDARVDDLMISYASDGGGVGPHVDSYDVFLLQLQGRRRWRVGRSRDSTWLPDLPLKILADFDPQHDWLLEPGDMLYLPPGWAHDGVAEGACMTASIGFRAPDRDEIARDVLQRIVDAAEPVDDDPRRYRDPAQAATSRPGEIPPGLRSFVAKAVARLLGDPDLVGCALGEVLSEPKPQVAFEAGGAVAEGSAVRLDRQSRMLHDDRFVFINGESFRVAGRDAKLMRRLADQRRLGHRQMLSLSGDAQRLLAGWIAHGWLHAESEP